MRKLIIAVCVCVLSAGCFGSGGEFGSCAEACAKTGTRMASCDAERGCICAVSDAGAP